MREIELVSVKLRTMSDEDLWSFFVQHRELCSLEFWEEVDNRKAAGILSETSPFWSMNLSLAQRERRRWFGKWNVIELTPEEWEARKRRTMFRVIPA